MGANVTEPKIKKTSPNKVKNSFFNLFFLKFVFVIIRSSFSNKKENSNSSNNSY